MTSSEYQRQSSRSKLLEEVDTNIPLLTSSGKKRGKSDPKIENDDSNGFSIRGNLQKSAESSKEVPLKDLVRFI